VSVCDLLLPLAAGSRILLANSQQAKDPTLLRSLILTRRPTILQGTPTIFRILLNAGWCAGEGAVNLWCAGEAIDRALGKKLLEVSRSFWNIYGPTECTVYSSIKKIVSEEDVTIIGSAIRNTELYIVDRQMRLQPIGVAGELCIGGVGLARG